MSDEEYKPRQKPVLDDDTKNSLSKRNRMSNKRPKFKRQNWFRYKRLGEKWRRPRGIHSKMRRHFKYRIPVVQSGFRGPANVRGLHLLDLKKLELIHQKKWKMLIRRLRRLE